MCYLFSAARYVSLIVPLSLYVKAAGLTERSGERHPSEPLQPFQSVVGPGSVYRDLSSDIKSNNKTNTNTNITV